MKSSTFQPVIFWTHIIVSKRQTIKVFDLYLKQYFVIYTIVSTLNSCEQSFDLVLLLVPDLLS